MLIIKYMIRARKFRKFLVNATILIVLVANGFSQIHPPQESADEAEVLVATWDTRVKELLRLSETGAGRLSDPEHAYYLALLARITWKYDEPTARLRLGKASNLVFSQLTETGSGEKRKLRFASKALNIMFELDRAYTAELIRRVNSSFDQDGIRVAAQDPELADLFGAIGRKVVEFNPELGYNYGIRSLRYGISDELPGLAVQLNDKDGSLAERFVLRAAAAARGRYRDDSYRLAFNLNRHFSGLEKPKYASNQIRRAAAELFSDLLAGAAQVESERPRRCGIAFYAPTVAPGIGELFPDRVLGFEQNFRLCLPHLKGADKQTTAVKGDGVPESIDDILKAARDTTDKDLKIWLYREALFRMLNAKEFDRMLSILDGLDGDEYEKHAPIAWGNWRVRAGYGAAITAFEAGDIAGTARYVNQTPARLRPFVREKLAATKSVAEDRTFLTETLNGMQIDLASMEVPSHDAAKLFLSLTELYLQAIPSESEKTFSKAVQYINKWDSGQQEKPTDDDWAPMYDYVSVSASLLDVDDHNVLAALRNITAPRSRLRLTLGLLESSLKAHEDAVKNLNAMKKAQSKAK